MPKENIDYKFLIDIEHMDHCYVKLLSGEWKDVVIKYGKVKLVENIENDNLTISYLFNINETPKHIDKNILDNDDNFKNYLGDILKDILYNNEFQIGNNGIES